MELRIHLQSRHFSWTQTKKAIFISFIVNQLCDMNLIQILLKIDIPKLHWLFLHLVIIFMDLFPDFSLLCIHFSYYINWNASFLTFILLFSLFYVDKIITVKSDWRFWKWWLTKSHSSIFRDHPKMKKSIYSWKIFIMLQKT